MRKEKLFALMFFTILVGENKAVLAYYDRIWTPLRLFAWFTDPLPIKLFPYEIVCIVLLVAKIGSTKGQVVRPLVRAIYVSMAALLFSVIYGLLRGGLSQPLNTQVHVWFFVLLFGLTAMCLLRKAEHFRLINTAIVWAAIWRASIAIIFYLQVQGSPWYEMPPHLTTHEDSMLFSIGLIILVSRAIELHTKSALRNLLLAAPVILAGIQFNNRRLAWASVAAGIIAVYAMLPAKSRATRNVNRLMKRLAPLLIIYVVVGWGRPGKLFKPLAAFSSMSGNTPDNSTRAREVEITSLFTMMQSSPLLGTGFGHQWVELDHRFTVSASTFPLYLYSPHNSVIALTTFMGGLGFAGLWMVLPISVFLNARAYRVSPNPMERNAAIVGIVEVIAFFNQAYGDMAVMNVTHMPCGAFVGVALASAARLAVTSGAWPGSSSSIHRKQDAHASVGIA